MRTLHGQALEDIVYGACILGSGGGGSLRQARKLLGTISMIAGEIKMADVSEVPEDSMLTVVAGIGSPDAGIDESLATAPARAFDLLEKTLKQDKENCSLSYVIGGEMGPINSLVPTLVAAYRKIPVIDGDGAGRAVPQLAMTTYHGKVPIAPFAIANNAKEPHDVKAVLHAKDASMIEQLVRPLVSSPAFGKAGAIAAWTMNGETLRQTAVTGTLSLAEKVGARLRQPDPLAGVLDILWGYRLFQGKLVSLDKQTRLGFDFSLIALQGDKDEKVWIYNQNENLIAWRGDRREPLAMAPDLISFLTPEGQPLSAADLTPDTLGKEIILLGFKAPTQLRQPQILRYFLEALRALGYAGPYIPIEQLH